MPTPLSATLWNLNFHPLETVDRYRDPQLQVGENYSLLYNFKSEHMPVLEIISLLILRAWKKIKKL